MKRISLKCKCVRSVYLVSSKLGVWRLPRRDKGREGAREKEKAFDAVG